MADPSVPAAAPASAVGTTPAISIVVATVAETATVPTCPPAASAGDAPTTIVVTPAVAADTTTKSPPPVPARRISSSSSVGSSSVRKHLVAPSELRSESVVVHTESNASWCRRHKLRLVCCCSLLVAAALVATIVSAVSAGQYYGGYLGGDMVEPGCVEDYRTPLSQSVNPSFAKYPTCGALAAALRHGTCGYWGAPRPQPLYAQAEAAGASSPLRAGTASRSPLPTAAAAAPAADDASAYSGTNNQVAGVDEADIVKAGPDGRHVFTLSSTNGPTRLIITRVEGARTPNGSPTPEGDEGGDTGYGTQVVSRTDLSKYMQGVSSMFVYGTKVVVIGRGRYTVNTVIPREASAVGPNGTPEMEHQPVIHSFATVTVVVLDITDPSAPVAVRRLDLEGSYETARLTGGTAHIIANTYPHDYAYQVPDDAMAADYLLPYFRDLRNVTAGELAAASSSTRDPDVYVGLPSPVVYDSANPGAYPEAHGGAAARAAAKAHFEAVSGCGGVHYSTGVNPNALVTIVSLPLADAYAHEPAGRTVVAGRASDVYASTSSIFIAGTNGRWGAELRTTFMEFAIPDATDPQTLRYGSGVPVGADFVDEETPRAPGAPVEFVGGFSAAGSLLNQFSMDQHRGRFRVAMTRSTRGSVPLLRGTTLNDVLVFSPHRILNVAGFLFTGRELEGSVLGLAPGETIKSARFMGDRGYLVTFRTTDPLFALDLSVPSNPRALGELKLPGYSTYLHPVNATHLIGFGQDALAVPNEWGGERVATQGLKLSLFNVTDVHAPVEQFGVTIGDRGTTSAALHEHKAFFFDPVRNLLVLPVQLSLRPRPAAVDDEAHGGPAGGEEVDPYAHAWTWGERVFEGAYAYRLVPGRFELAATFTHDVAGADGGRGRFDYRRRITRTLLLPPPMDLAQLEAGPVPPSQTPGTLVTLSEKMLLSVNLPTMHAIAAVEL